MSLREWLEGMREGFGVHSIVLEKFGIEKIEDMALMTKEDIDILGSDLKENSIPPLHARIIMRGVQEQHAKLMRDKERQGIKHRTWHADRHDDVL